jgi:hypothetical protein
LVGKDAQGLFGLIAKTGILDEESELLHIGFNLLGYSRVYVFAVLILISLFYFCSLLFVGLQFLFTMLPLPIQRGVLFFKRLVLAEKGVVFANGIVAVDRRRADLRLGAYDLRARNGQRTVLGLAMFRAKFELSLQFPNLNSILPYFIRTLTEFSLQTGHILPEVDDCLLGLFASGRQNALVEETGVDAMLTFNGCPAGLLLEIPSLVLAEFEGAFLFTRASMLLRKRARLDYQ